MDEQNERDVLLHDLDPIIYPFLIPMLRRWDVVTTVGDKLLASDWLRAHDRRVAAEAHAEAVAFSSALGFGDNVTEPAATLAQMVDPITEAFAAARDHNQCAVTCELCGEVLARTICEHCCGSGCGPGTALGAYSECEWCAGAGKVHEGCVEMPYADLAAERDRLAAKVARVEELADRWERRCSGGPHRLCRAGQLRAALAEEPPDA